MPVFAWSPTNIEISLRALDLRDEGLTYKRIGIALGIDASAAFRKCERMLQSPPADSMKKVHFYRQRELEALDNLERSLFEEMAMNHYRLGPGGRYVTYDGERVRDARPVLAAIRALLRLEARRSKILDLDLG